jgi:hypothetical protein
MSPRFLNGTSARWRYPLSDQKRHEQSSLVARTRSLLATLFFFSSGYLQPRVTSSVRPMAPALLTAVDSTAHVHLIVGSNPLAAARCARSIEVGARPILVAPADATLHYGLSRRIDEGEVQWLQRSFQQDDLTTLGREDVDGVVDAVFVTAGGKQSLG